MSFLITHDDEIKGRFFHVFDSMGKVTLQGQCLSVGDKKFLARVKGFEVDDEPVDVEYQNWEAQYFDWYLSAEEMNEALFNKYHVNGQWISRSGAFL